MPHGTIEPAVAIPMRTKCARAKFPRRPSRRRSRRTPRAPSGVFPVRVRLPIVEGPLQRGFSAGPGPTAMSGLTPDAAPRHAERGQTSLSGQGTQEKYSFWKKQISFWPGGQLRSRLLGRHGTGSAPGFPRPMHQPGAWPHGHRRGGAGRSARSSPLRAATQQHAHAITYIAH